LVHRCMEAIQTFPQVVSAWSSSEKWLALVNLVSGFPFQKLHFVFVFWMPRRNWNIFIAFNIPYQTGLLLASTLASTFKPFRRCSSISSSTSSTNLYHFPSPSPSTTFNVPLSLWTLTFTTCLTHIRIPIDIEEWPRRQAQLLLPLVFCLTTCFLISTLSRAPSPFALLSPTTQHLDLNYHLNSLSKCPWVIELERSIRPFSHKFPFTFSFSNPP